MQLRSCGRTYRMVARAVLVSCVAAAGCDALLQADYGFANDARVTVEGTSPVPLLLLTSTRYTTLYNASTGQWEASLVVADTQHLATLPFDGSYDLRRKDRFLVRLVNPDSAAEAVVHLQVRMDGRLVYTQRASMRDAALQYMTYFRP
jgi:hypothetical protein